MQRLIEKNIIIDKTVTEEKTYEEIDIFGQCGDDEDSA
jgi:hypothetical protein